MLQEENMHTHKLVCVKRDKMHAQHIGNISELDTTFETYNHS